MDRDFVFNRKEEFGKMKIHKYYHISNKNQEDIAECLHVQERQKHEEYRSENMDRQNNLERKRNCMEF